MKCKWGGEVIIGAKNIEEWWEQDVEWIIHVDVEVKNDGKSTLGKESNEPGAGGLEAHGDRTWGKGLRRITCSPEDSADHIQYVSR